MFLYYKRLRNVWNNPDVSSRTDSCSSVMSLYNSNLSLLYEFTNILYVTGIYSYFFLAKDYSTSTFQFASQVLRPIFQWLSLLSSSLNPLIYIVYSQKYRRAFRQLLVLPCRQRHERTRSMTQSTLKSRLKSHSPDEMLFCGRFNGDSKSACDIITLPSITILSTLNIPCPPQPQRTRYHVTTSF